MPEFVRGANGSVIGITLDGHPDDAPDASQPSSMIPVVPIPEHAIIGDLPDVVTQSEALGAANDRVAELEAQIAAMQAAQAAAQAPPPPAPAAAAPAPPAPSWEGLASTVGGAPPAAPAPAAPADPNAPPAQ